MIILKLEDCRVVNRKLPSVHGGSLEIILTFSLKPRHLKDNILNMTQFGYNLEYLLGKICFL